jgi:hypothetical protein
VCVCDGVCVVVKERVTLCVRVFVDVAFVVLCVVFKLFGVCVVLSWF